MQWEVKPLMNNSPVFKIISNSPKHTQEIGARIGKIVQHGDILLLLGNLGAGKTCLTQGIARGMGIKEYTSSPSFVMVKEYQGRIPLFHIDLYRIEHIEETNSLGLDDYLYGNGVCVIEWADRALDLLPAESMLIKMNYLSQTSRSLEFQPEGKRYHTMLTDLYFLFSDKEKRQDKKCN